MKTTKIQEEIEKIIREYDCADTKSAIDNTLENTEFQTKPEILEIIPENHKMHLGYCQECNEYLETKISCIKLYYYLTACNSVIDG